MKKVLALILVAALLCICCACEQPSDTSNDTSSSAGTSSKDTNSKDTNSKDTNSKDTNSKDTNSKDTSSETSTEESGDTSSEDTNALKTNGMFVCFGDAAASKTKDAYTAKLVGTGAPDKEPNAIMLNGYNTDVEVGGVYLFNSAYTEGTIPAEDNDYADYAIVIAEYTQSVFNYTLKQYYAVGENDDKAIVEIPEDGFVLVAHKDNSYASKLGEITETNIIVPVGTPTPGFEATIKQTSVAPAVDGKVGSGEYGTAPVWKIDYTEKYFTYSDFVKDDYYVSGNIYMTYDKDNLYVAVELQTPYHHCPLAKDKAKEMWKYECIQVNLVGIAPDSDYMAEHFDWGGAAPLDPTLSNENLLYQYGFAVSSNEGNENLTYRWAGKTEDFTGKYVGVRDDVKKTTVYEFSVPLNLLGNETYSVKGEKGQEISFGLSVNSTNEADEKAGSWRNVIMRNGGGVIGRNDLAKSAKIIFG